MDQALEIKRLLTILFYRTRHKNDKRHITQTVCVIYVLTL